MMHGLFDLPAPLLHWANESVAGWFSTPVVIALWASLGAILSLELYRLLSPQERIGRIKRKADKARQQLANFDGKVEDAWPLIKSMLASSLRRVGIVLPATLLAAYPIVVLFIWLSNQYDHRFPTATESVQVDVAPPLEAKWIAADNQLPRIQVSHPRGAIIMEVPVAAPIPELHKPAWWNILIANPAGYLPESAPIDEIHLHLPAQKFITWGPALLQGWEVIFVPVLFSVSLVYKFARHIH